MNGIKIKKHAAAILLLSCTMVMASCNNPGTVASSASDTTASSSEEPLSTVDGVIRFSSSCPTDLQIGSTTNLEDYITVTVADSWRIETKDTNVQIDGHNIKAVAYGDFTLTIIAGRTRRAYRGHVVTEEKIQFNQLLNSFSKNYRAMLIGPQSTTEVTLYADYLHAENYYAQLTETQYTYEGAIKDKNGRGHSFTAKVDSTGQFNNVVVNPGYIHLDDATFNPWSIRGEAFRESIQEDADGNPVSTIYLADAEDPNSLSESSYLDEIAETTGLSLRQLNRLSGYTFLGGSDITDVVAEFDAESKEIVFVFTNDKHALPGKKQAFIAVQLGMVGSVSIADVQKAYDEDNYPAALSAEKVATLTNEMNLTKKYHVKSVGSWVDPKGTQYECPSSFRYGDTGTDIFWNFNADAYVDGEAYYERINAISTNVYKNTETNLLPNAVNAYVLHNGSVYEAKGTYKDSKNTWDTTKTAVYKDAGKSIWSDKLVLTSAGLTEDALKTLNVLSVSDDGNTFTFNDLDTANKNTVNKFFGILFAFGPTHSGNTFWQIINRAGLEKFVESSLVYNPTDKTLVYTAKLSELAAVQDAQGNAVYLNYQFVTTIDAVGTDNLASGVEAELFPAA